MLLVSEQHWCGCVSANLGDVFVLECSNEAGNVAELQCTSFSNSACSQVYQKFQCSERLLYHPSYGRVDPSRYSRLFQESLQAGVGEVDRSG